HAVQAAPVGVLSAISAAVTSSGSGTGNGPALAKLALEAPNGGRRRALLAGCGLAALLLIVALFGLRWFVPPPTTPPPTQTESQPVAKRESSLAQVPQVTSQPPPVPADANQIIFRVIDSVTGAAIPDARLASKQVDRI